MRTRWSHRCLCQTDDLLLLAAAPPKQAANLALSLVPLHLAPAPAVLALLAPVILVRSREPFERLVVILEVVQGRMVGQGQE
jgi:hypothetical protein